MMLTKLSSLLPFLLFRHGRCPRDDRLRHCHLQRQGLQHRRDQARDDRPLPRRVLHVIHPHSSRKAWSGSELFAIHPIEVSVWAKGRELGAKVVISVRQPQAGTGTPSGELPSWIQTSHLRMFKSPFVKSLVLVFSALHDYGFFVECTLPMKQTRRHVCSRHWAVDVDESSGDGDGNERSSARC